MCCEIKRGTYLIKVSKGFLIKKRQKLNLKKKNFDLLKFLNKLKIRKV